MATTDFSLPVTGVTGTAFRNTLLSIIAALASNSESVSDPPVTYAGMLQVKTTAGVPLLRIRNQANNGWVTLLPDVRALYGGLNNAIFSGNNVFSGSNDFTGPTTFTTIPAGLASDAELSAAIATRTTTSQVNSLIAAAVPPVEFTKGSVNSITPVYNNTQNISHGLGEIPKLVTAEIVMVDSGFGYDNGHVIDIANVSGSSGIAIRKDSSILQVVIGSSIPILRRDSFLIINTTSTTAFNLRIRAYA